MKDRKTKVKDRNGSREDNELMPGKTIRTPSGGTIVDPEHFREYRLRVVTERLESMPDLIDRLYKRLG
jgi:hypothetical protein